MSGFGIAVQVGWGWGIPVLGGWLGPEVKLSGVGVGDPKV